MIKTFRNYFFKIIFLIIFLSLSLNLSRRLDRKDSFIDAWSELVVYSTLLYNADYNKLTMIPNRIIAYRDHSNLENIDIIDPHGYYQTVVEKDKHMTSSHNEYQEYTSNLVIQSTIFVQLFLSPLYKFGIPISYITKMVKLINVFLFSLVISLFMFSLRAYFSRITLITLAILIAMFSTHINASSKSFYWSIWIYLLPYLVQYALLQSKRYQKLSVNKKALVTLLVAFGSMILFFSFHLETFTGAVIAMFLPYILEFNKNALSKKVLIKQILAIVIGSFLAMISILMVKFLLVSYYLGWQETLARQQDNLLDRLRLNSYGEMFSFFKTGISLRLTDIYFSFLDIITIKGKDIFLLTILLYPISFGLMKHYSSLKSKVLNLLIIHWILFIAAVSWYVLAIPHSTIHMIHLQFLITLFYIIPTSLVIIEVFKMLLFDRFLETKSVIIQSNLKNYVLLAFI